MRGAPGDLFIEKQMKLRNLPITSFRDLGRQWGLKIELFEGRLVVIAPRWREALSTESTFCKAVVANGYLTERQMLRAARRYRLGCTRQGGVIFWQIDASDELYDGKVMYYREDCHRDKQRHPTWVSTLLSRRYQWTDADSLTTRHCFFGLHLLCHTYLTDNTEIFGSLRVRTTQDQPSDISHQTSFRVTNKPVCVVESEKSAVILSEHFPQNLWLATGGMGNVQPDKFHPLRGRRVILFPDTDTEGKTFKSWFDAAQLVMQQIFWEDSPPITVSPLLELHATPEQKAAKIDLVDFLFDPP